MSATDIQYPPGKSPFHVKGVVYLGLREYFAEQILGGLEALTKEFPDDELRAFFAGQFLTGGWYDALPLLPILTAASQAKSISLPQVIREGSRFQARRDIRGIHRLLLKLVSPEHVVVRLPRVLPQYFDFCKAETTIVGRGHAESWLEGMPVPLIPWWRPAAETFTSTALTMAGAREVGAFWYEPEPMGEAHGVSVVRLRSRITWSR